MNITLINLLISVPAIIIFVLAVLFGMFRKTVKAAVKLGTILVAFFLSIPIAFAVSKTVAKPVGALIISLLAKAGITEETLASMPTLEALPGTLAYSVAAPFVFAVCFIVLSLLLLIAYHFLKKAVKPLDEKQSGVQHKVFGALIGAVVALVLIVGVYTPVVGLVDTVASLEITEKDLDGISGADAVITAKGYADGVDSSPLFAGTQALGGKWLYGTLSSAKLNGEKIVLKNELSHMLDAALSATAFKGVKVDNIGDAQVDALYNIEAAATESEILMGILPEVLSSASKAWIEGNEFLGMKKPVMNEMITGAFDALLKIFATSSKDNIEEDLHTLVSLADAVVDSGMLTKIGNTEELMTLMQQDGVVSSMAVPLYDNPRMTVLVPEIINIGLRAAAKVMNIPESKEALHSNFTSEVAGELNAMADLSVSEMTDVLTGKMDKICANYALKISDTEKYCLAVGISYEFNGRSDITDEEVADFFTEYTAYIENEESEIVTKRVKFDSITVISYGESKAYTRSDSFLVTFKNAENIGEFVTLDATKNADGSLTVKKNEGKMSGAAYAAALMKLLREQADAIFEGKGNAEEAKVKVMELTLDMAGSAEDSEKISQSLSAKMEKDVENGVELQPKLASKPENFPTEIPVVSDILFTEEDDFAPIVNNGNKDKDKEDKEQEKDDKKEEKEQQKADKKKDKEQEKAEKEAEKEKEKAEKEQQKAANQAAAKAVEKIAKAVSTLSTVLVKNDNVMENMNVIMKQTGVILDGITEISESGSEKASLLTKSILSCDIVADRIPVSKDKLIDMAEAISNDVIKAREEAKKEQEKQENENKPSEGNTDTEPEVTVAPTTEAPVTVAPVTDAPVTEAPATTAAVTTAAPVTTAAVTTAPVTAVTTALVTEAPVTTVPVTEAPVTVAPEEPEVPETEEPGYENFFGATGEMLVNIMILTSDASAEEKFAAIEAMMGNISTTSAKALSYVCDADLLMEYGIKEEYAGGLAEGLGVLFNSLSEEVKPEDRAAVRSLFSLVFINKNAKNLFAGDGDSTLNTTAYAFVKTIISSRAVCNAVQVISIDLSDRKLSEFDIGSLEIAFEKNYEQATKSYQKKAIDALSEIFGVDYDISIWG
ncbi:MAG: CvpA family protein [Ruminococcaceae bacterium]|nr:CvpA family protein [Oscillospiraceae bacterium]